jgi:hypothetical protein
MMENENKNKNWCMEKGLVGIEGRKEHGSPGGVS